MLKPKYFGVCLVMLTMTPTVFAESKAEDTPEGCPLSTAIQGIDGFVEERLGVINHSNMHELSEMTAASANAKTPGVAIGSQMTPKEIERFNAARHALVNLAMEKMDIQKFQRNAHLISEVLEVAKLADSYDVKQGDLGRDDPRQFYYKILLMLRANQPKTTRTTRINIKCDPEAGLYFEEDFALHQITDNSVLAPQMKNLIADIERLRSLYQVFWKAFNHNIDDDRATRWNGDEANTPDTLAPMVEGSDEVTKRLYKIVVAYIDEQLPTEEALVSKYRRKISEKAQADNPLKDQ